MVIDYFSVSVEGIDEFYVVYVGAIGECLCLERAPRAQRPPACPVRGGSNLILCATRSEPPSVLRVRADCGSRLFTPKFGVVVHNLAHQPPQSLADGRRHPAGSSVLRLSSRSHQLLHLLQRYRLWL